MKAIKTIVAAIVVVAASFCATPASAQFRIGPKIGMNVSKLHFDKSIADTENSAGFNAGLMAEFTVPVIGIGADVSVMYVRRNDKFVEDHDIMKSHRDYIDIPVNLKWKMNIPIIANLVKPFLTTGPSFAFLTSKSNYEDFKHKKCDVAWNFGFGAEIFGHMQVGASYGLGLNKAWETVGNEAAGISGKNRYWTITAAYLF